MRYEIIHSQEFQNGGNFVVVTGAEDLEHHGILGQKWGVRRFQTKSGKLTALGKKRLKDPSGADFDGDRVSSSGRAGGSLRQKSGKGGSGNDQEASNDKPSAKREKAQQTVDAAKRLAEAAAEKYQRDQKTQSVYSSASSAARNLANTANRSATAARERAKSNINLSTVSDSDLKAMINRLNMEKQYRDLATETVGTGKRQLSDMLQTAGDVLAIGASAAAILGAIHQYKSRK